MKNIANNMISMGKPYIKGTRLKDEFVLELLAVAHGRRRKSVSGHGCAAWCPLGTRILSLK
jgi:hypothetical protein